MFERVQAFFAEKVSVPAESITMETELTGLGVDSMSLLMVIMDFETEFGIEISDRQLGSLYTIGDVVALVENQGK